MSYQESTYQSPEKLIPQAAKVAAPDRKLSLRSKAAIIGLPLAAVGLAPVAAATAANAPPQPIVTTCENNVFDTSETHISKLSSKPVTACLGEQTVRLTLDETTLGKPESGTNFSSAPKIEQGKKVKKCDTYYFDTKVRYTAGEYRGLRKRVSGERPEGWTKAKYAQARSLPLAPAENCEDRAKLYELNNFEARLRKEHPKEILKVLGKKQGWSDYEIAATSAIIEGGMGIPANKAENPTWNPCRKQGQNENISCERAVELGHPSTEIGYGIPQSTPADKMASEGEDWETNPVPQIKWFIQYVIKSRGGPIAAYQYKLVHGNY